MQFIHRQGLCVDVLYSTCMTRLRSVIKAISTESLREDPFQNDVERVFIFETSFGPQGRIQSFLYSTFVTVLTNIPYIR